MLRNRSWPANWPCITLKIVDSSCTSLHHGAHIDSCKLNAAEKIFWLSPQLENPLCWLNLGVNPNFPHLAKHRIAKSLMWEKIHEKLNDSQSIAIFSLSHNAMQTYNIPQGINLQFTVTLNANTLKTDLEVFNQSPAVFESTESQHAYFSISDINNIALHGWQNSSYSDCMTNTQETNTKNEFYTRNPSDLNFPHHQKEINIVDPGKNRCICVNKNNAGGVAIWNPYQTMPLEVTDISVEYRRNFNSPMLSRMPSQYPATLAIC